MAKVKQSSGVRTIVTFTVSWKRLEEMDTESHAFGEVIATLESKRNGILNTIHQHVSWSPQRQPGVEVELGPKPILLFTFLTPGILSIETKVKKERKVSERLKMSCILT